jgi:hypothetical protein
VSNFCAVPVLPPTCAHASSARVAVPESTTDCRKPRRVRAVSSEMTRRSGRGSLRASTRPRASDSERRICGAISVPPFATAE